MAQAILHVIKKALENRDPGFLIFTDLDRSVASQILADLEDPKYRFHESGFRLHYSALDGYLRLVMPTELHEFPVSWMISEYGAWLAHAHLTCDGFKGDYAGSKKQTDLALNPCVNYVRSDYPSVVLESGLSESGAQLMSDSRLWLKGTGGATRVVFLCKTFAPDQYNKIKATLSICRILPNGEISKDELQVFPPPTDNEFNPYITVAELFGGIIPEGLASNAQLPLSMQRLREILGAEIRRRGFLTA
ncbi:hypothetical protein HOY82DRAFT_666324 [Tuber indicum]|nr:hypothetical protein HOY82DRAFT_666324 [Tuber indicum]